MPPRTPKPPLTDEQLELRREAGAWVKTRREAAGLSQRDLALRVGVDYYSFISQIETGKGRLPAERYEAFANALNIPVREFTKTLLRFNEPIIHDLLFGPRHNDEPSAMPADSATDDKDELMTLLEKRLIMLESRLGLVEHTDNGVAPITGKR